MNRILLALILLLVPPLLPAQQAGKGLTELPQRIAAPDFMLSDMDGQQHRLSDYRGKVVIVNFWATWCPPCRAEMPSMQRAWERLQKEDIFMLGIDVGEDEDTVFQFSANYPVEFPLLLDLDSSVANQWPLRGVPTTFVIDTKGQIAYRAIGGREWDDPALLALVRLLKDE
ncbi:MAG: TlpA family protein disulfide reductase [gamma proteobacterium symbiont of Bathyaustriella thionipta]|nr:TlpA family protein disulfide reductase [gamma proteobacterium symbiont of Bathyaustriella thionipta]